MGLSGQAQHLKLGAGLLLLPKHPAGRVASSQVWVSALLSLAHQPTSGSLTGTEMKTNPQFWTAHK